jgi:hypothetical protein
MPDLGSWYHTTCCTNGIAYVKNISRPNFFVLGAAKCGTTSLYRYLNEHPEVFMATPKETHFFDLNYENGMSAYWEQYFAQYRFELAVGEATPSYYFLPFVAKRIFRECPDARLILILRNPVARAYSAWWMLYTQGVVHESFNEAIENNLCDRRINFSGENGERLWRDYYVGVQGSRRDIIPMYLQEGYYVDYVRMYLDTFPTDQLKVVLFEDLEANPTGLTRDLWSFLGVRSDIDLQDPTPQNAALSGVAIRVKQLAYRNSLMRIARDILPMSIRSNLKRALSKTAKRPDIDPHLRAQLCEHFYPYNVALEGLLGIDLSVWNE